MIGIGAVALLIVAYRFMQENKPPKSYHNAKTENGLCSINGNIRKFSINCEKSVKKIQYSHMSAKKIQFFGSLTKGVQENLEILLVEPKKIEGSDKVKNSLSFSILHDDQSATLVTLEKI